MRPSKREPGIEMGLKAEDGHVCAVPSPAADGDEPTSMQMLEVGFAGEPAGRRGIYTTFFDDGGAPSYKREAVREELQALCTSDEVVLLAWPQCGFATKARKQLADFGITKFADVTISKFSPQHAELALVTGRPSVPYVFVNGECVGGCEADATHPGLARALGKRTMTTAAAAGNQRMSSDVSMLSVAGQPPTPAEARPIPPTEVRFPTATTPPSEVVAAQLDALQAGDMRRVVSLFSRARRAVLADTGRAQSCAPPPAVLERRAEIALREHCPGLLRHSCSELLSALQVEERRSGRLPHWRCRVRVEAAPDNDDGLASDTAVSRTFEFTLTRQHDPPPPSREVETPTMLSDFRNACRFDGNEGCWLVWDVSLADGGDDDGGSDGRGAGGGPSGGAAKAEPRQLAMASRRTTTPQLVAPPTAATEAETCRARLLVLDTLLPGQRMRCADAPDSFAALVEDSKEPLVCVGRNRLSLHWVGCEATASRDESGSIVLTASDRLAQVEGDYSDDGGSKWNGRVGSVTWLGRLSEQDDLLSADDSYSLAKALEHGSNSGMEVSPERLARLAKEVRRLTDEFVSLAGPSVEGLLEQLGPAPEGLNAQAVYVAALLNPIGTPINDDFLFIRPAVMTTRSTGNRLDYAQRGLQDAIKRLQ